MLNAGRRTTAFFFLISDLSIFIAIADSIVVTISYWSHRIETDENPPIDGNLHDSHQIDQ
jgi:hypothetical protein